MQKTADENVGLSENECKERADRLWSCPAGGWQEPQHTLYCTAGPASVPAAARPPEGERRVTGLRYLYQSSPGPHYWPATS